MMDLPWLNPAWTQLARRFSEDTMPHALLLLGPSGAGKRILADRLITAALCSSRTEHQQACGRCRECLLVQAGTHADLYRCVLQDDSRQIKVDQIRALAHKATLTEGGGRRVLLIDPADAMNVNAANALLKTLEEPPGNTLIILIADRLRRLPATILSRCQRINIALPDTETALYWLAEQGTGSSDARAALRAAGGAPLRAQAMVENDEVGEFTRLLVQLGDVASGRGDPVSVSAAWQDERLSQRLSWWAECLNHLLWQRQQVASSEDDAITRLNRLTATISARSLLACYDKVNRARGLLETPVRPELLTDELLLEWRQAGNQT